VAVMISIGQLGDELVLTTVLTTTQVNTSEHWRQAKAWIQLIHRHL